MAKTTDGALGYFDEQIEEVKKHTSAALRAFDAHAVHQARVATRRLKAGFGLLDELTGKQAKDVNNAGKKLRRRLGPLRDYDVQIEALQKYAAQLESKSGARLKPALDWLIHALEESRDRARQADQKEGKSPAKMLDPFDRWWQIRHELEGTHEAVHTLLVQKLHDGYAEFAKIAGWVCGLDEPPEEKKPIDVHELRIDGKNLRYTFEIASAHGIRLPKSIFKTFKSMQDSLGEWHDYVVMCEEAMRQMLQRELPLHDRQTSALVIDLAKRFLKDSEKHLQRFITQWKRSGARVGQTLKQKAPLSRDVSARTDEIRPQVGRIQQQVSELKTDLDQLAPARTESPDTLGQAAQPDEQG